MKYINLFEAFSKKPDPWSPELIELWRLGLVEIDLWSPEMKEIWKRGLAKPEPWIEEVLGYLKRGSVGGLDLSGTQVKSLPPGLEVDGTLRLYGTPIQFLPPGLRVEGKLWLNDSSVESLPPGLKVGGSLWANNTPLSRSGVTEPELRAQLRESGGWVEGNIYIGNLI